MELTCVQEFDTEQLYRVSKIAGICSLIQIYQKEGLPLLFSSSVGNLGNISIFVKDKKQIQEEDLGKNEDSEE